MRRGRALHELTTLLAGAIPADAEWEDAMYLAGEQLVVPQLLARLKAVEHRLPKDVLDYLSETRVRSIQRNERLFSTLEDTLAALNRAGIEPILLKGCAQWANGAGAPGDRLVRDLDLLVRPTEMQAAVDALLGAGFDILSDERATSVHDVVVLGRPADVGSIDLHQHAPALQGVKGLGDFHANANTVAVAGGVAKVLSPELQILIMAVHDQVHDALFWRGGFNIRHLLDVAELAKKGVDWRRVVSLCRTRTERVALDAHLHAARAIAQADVPDEVLSLWGRLHFWRQRAQFVWPLLTRAVELVRLSRARLRPASADARARMRAISSAG